MTTGREADPPPAPSATLGDDQRRTAPPRGPLVSTALAALLLVTAAPQAQGEAPSAVGVWQRATAEEVGLDAAHPWDSFATVGYGTQVLYLVPELDMLVVVTATLESKGAAWDRRFYRTLREQVFAAAS